MHVRKLLLVAAIAGLVVAWFALGLDRYLKFEALKELRDLAHAQFQEAPVLTLSMFFAAVEKTLKPIAPSLLISFGERASCT